VLTDQELVQVLLAARKIGGPYGGIVELLALTGQRREEVAGMKWEELDLARRVWTLPRSRTKNAKEHVVHLSKQSLDVLKGGETREGFVFAFSGTKPFNVFSRAKRHLDQISGVIRETGFPSIGIQIRPLRRTKPATEGQTRPVPHRHAEQNVNLGPRCQRD
jgi:integrase